MKTTLTIYQTNDIHSHFSALARIVSYLRRHRGPDDLYVDCGDLLDLQDLTVQGTGGIGGLRLIAQAGVDAMAVGNNEIDLERNALRACSDMGIPLMACNVTDDRGNQIGHTEKSVILERGGIRFLLLGVSPYYSRERAPDAYNLFFTMGGIQSSDPFAAIHDELARRKGTYDFCVLLSHSGLDIDRWILEEIPEIDLCFGGHSHSLLADHRYLQSGQFGEHLGAAHLTVKNGKVIRVTTEILNIDDEPKDPAFLELWEEQKGIAEAKMDETLYEIEPLAWDAVHESLLTNFIADALFAKYPCDFAFVNAGIVNGPIGGRVSKKILLELSPSKLNPTRFPVSGDRIRRAVLHALDDRFVRQPGHGAGARWDILGTLGFSHNIRIQAEPLAIFVNGEPLNEERVYLCTAHDALQRGTGYTELRTDNERAEFFDGFIRDLLERTLCNPDILEKARIRRWTQ